MHKMHQNTFGSRVLAGPAGGAYALPQVSSPDLLAATGPTSKRREGRGWGLFSGERKGGKGERGDEKGEEGNVLPPK